MMMTYFGTAVFVLCALTSIACAWLLFRAYARTRVRLLFWSGLCFTGLALNNVLLFVDIKVLPQTDLSVIRTIPALAGVLLLLFGMIRESM